MHIKQPLNILLILLSICPLWAFGSSPVASPAKPRCECQDLPELTDRASGDPRKCYPTLERPLTETFVNKAIKFRLVRPVVWLRYETTPLLCNNTQFVCLLYLRDMPVSASDMFCQHLTLTTFPHVRNSCNFVSLARFYRVFFLHWKKILSNSICEMIISELHSLVLTLSNTSRQRLVSTCTPKTS